MKKKTLHVKYLPCKFYNGQKIYGTSEWIFISNEGKVYKKNVSKTISEIEDIFIKGIKIAFLELGLSYKKLSTFQKINDREYIFIYE
jgi:hypothetical protein